MEEDKLCNEDAYWAVESTVSVVRLMNAIIKSIPKVKALVDPHGRSCYMQEIERRINDAFTAVGEQCLGKAKEDWIGFSADEWRQHKELMRRTERELASVREALGVLQGCYERMGITPWELERLMKRYEVETSPSGLPCWFDVEEVQEKALAARVRSDKGGSKNRRVNDEQIILVVKNGHDMTRQEQADALHLTVRQLQRRIDKLKEVGRLQD